LQGDHGSRKGFGDDFILNRAEKHVSDRENECDEDKDQQGRDQAKGAQFLSTQGFCKAFLEGGAVSGENRSAQI